MPKQENRMSAIGKVSALAGAVLVLGFMRAPLVTAQETPASTEDQRLAAFFEEVFQRNLKDSPLFQSQLGMKGPDYGKWGDFSDTEAIRQNGLTKQDLDRLRADFDYTKLSAGSIVGYRVFEYQQESRLRNFPWRFHNYAFTTMTNPATSFFAFLQNVHRVDDVSDAEAYVSRLAGLGQVYDEGVKAMNVAADRGIVPTSYSFDPVLADGRAVLTGAPFDDSGTDSALLADFRAKVDKLDMGVRLSFRSVQRMLKYHSSRLLNGFTPRVTGWAINFSYFGDHIGFTEY
jgi:uncharacterized protein (DUF885 family)